MASGSPRPSPRYGSRPVHSAARERVARRRSYARAARYGALHLGCGADRNRSRDGLFGVERDRVRAARRHRVLPQTPAGLARRRVGRRVRSATGSTIGACEALRRICLVAAIAGLLLVFVPHVGVGVNGGRRWIGASSLSIEPSEFAKLALVIYLSAVLVGARRSHHVARARPRSALRAGRDHGRARAQRARHGHGEPAALHRAYALLCRRRAPRSSRGGRARDGSVRRDHRARKSVPAGARLCLPRSVEGSAQHRLPHRPVAFGARQRRPLRRRIGRLAREVLLSARAVHRLHLLGARRRAGLDRHARRRRALRHVGLSRRSRSRSPRPTVSDSFLRSAAPR